MDAEIQNNEEVANKSFEEQSETMSKDDTQQRRLNKRVANAFIRNALSKTSSPASENVFVNVIDENIRTNDVISDVKSFSDLMISPKICELLQKHQYTKPTPVQAKAIPLLLLGSDMLVQAKAGTGKTLVFAVLAAKILHESEKTRAPQVLIVAPTREIAKQIYDTVRHFIPSTFWAGLFVGGTEVTQDIQLLKKGCQIAIGTCGRIAQLLSTKVLNLKEVQLCVLDEADKLMEADFIKHVNLIFSSMPQTMKQVCVFSATYPKNLEEILKNFMCEPTLLRLNVDEEQLIGIREYCVLCDTFKKADGLMELLKNLVFNQCIIFCETIEMCKKVHNYLLDNEIECTSLDSNLPQDQRFQILKKFKNKQIRILVATDLMSRGVDITGVDLVICLSPSYDIETHMHRVGRAGRYGGIGVAISILGNSEEADKLFRVMQKKSLDIRLLDLHKEFPYNLVEDTEFHARSVRFNNQSFSDPYGNKLATNLSSMKISPNTQTAISNYEEESSHSTVEIPAIVRTRKIFYLRRDFYQIYANWDDKQWIEYQNTSMNLLDYSCVTGVFQPHNELKKFSAEHASMSIYKLPVKQVENIPYQPENLLESTNNNVETVHCFVAVAEEYDDLDEEAPSPVIDDEPIQIIDGAEGQPLEPFGVFHSFKRFRRIYAHLEEEAINNANNTGQS